MASMNAIEKLEEIKAFEARHDVTAYQAAGWHVWPLVRILLGFNAIPRNAPSPLRLAWTRTMRPVVGYWRAVLRQYRRPAKATDSLPGPASVVFLTQSGRRVWWRESFYEIYTDPLVEMLQGMEESFVVWEAGQKKMPQATPSRAVSTEIVDELYRSFAHTRRLPQPDWFAELQPLFLKMLGRKLAWREVADHIVLVTAMAGIFERWLDKVRPKVIIEVCWYSNRSMALNLAARRLGIKTVDLQHGVQGKGHFAYSGWQQFPSQGYEVMPTSFWCWGQASAADLVAYNPGLQTKARILVGGNPWLNKWRPQPFQQRASDPKRKDILVTLQHDVSNVLLEGIKKSPEGWRWRIRFHPARSTKYREADLALFAATGHKGIETDVENELPLYKCLQQCDVHVTESSTCALEALAFGVGTVVLSDTRLGRVGCFYFRSYIDNDVMHVANTAEELLSRLLSMVPLASTHEMASEYFAESAFSVKVLEELLDVQRIEALS